jgi:hypothetical protein
MISRISPYSRRSDVSSICTWDPNIFRELEVASTFDKLTSLLSNFMSYINRHPYLGPHMENGWTPSHPATWRNIYILQPPYIWPRPSETAEHLFVLGLGSEFTQGTGKSAFNLRCSWEQKRRNCVRLRDLTAIIMKCAFCYMTPFFLVEIRPLFGPTFCLRV